MSKDTSTRRGFFVTAGAALSAPAAFAGTGGATTAEATPAARLAELEDENALRRISADLIRALNAGSNEAVEPLDDDLRDIVAEEFDSNAKIRFSDARRSALVQLGCTAGFDVRIEAPGSALLDMARSQGEGCIRTQRRQVLELRCERTRSGWQLQRARLLSA